MQINDDSSQHGNDVREVLEDPQEEESLHYLHEEDDGEQDLVGEVSRLQRVLHDHIGYTAPNVDQVRVVANVTQIAGETRHVELACVVHGRVSHANEKENLIEARIFGRRIDVDLVDVERQDEHINEVEDARREVDAVRELLPLEHEHVLIVL